MTLLQKGPPRGPCDKSDLESREGTNALAHTQVAALDSDLDSQFDRFATRSWDEACPSGITQDAAASSPAELESDTSGLPTAKTGAGERLSRDLVDVYFRQMGDIALLSREDEIALAKRMEAAQQAVVRGLCRVPMLVERIAMWAQEVAEGQLRLANFVDPPMPADDLAARAIEQRSQDASASDDLPYYGDTPHLQPEPAERLDQPEREDAATLSPEEPGQKPVAAACLRQLAVLSGQIGALSRKQQSNNQLALAVEALRRTLACVCRNSHRSLPRRRSYSTCVRIA